VKVLKREYWAWPVPAINVWVRNRILARALAREIYAFAIEGAGPISIVAHSNGADIALRAAHRLSALGVRLKALVLLGAACEADIVRSGVFALVSGDGLDRAIAYSSEDDLALRSALIWPFGRLGFTGWRLRGCSFQDARIFTRWYPGFGHGEYFSAGEREKTFDRIWRDCGLPYDVPAGGER
jgi:pimeloyl-ACP methyl ester carboxylesterase